MREFTLREYLAASANRLPLAIHHSFTSVLLGRLLVIAVRIGLFEQLAAGDSSATAIAASLRLAPESADLMIRSLASAGYLRTRGSRISLTRQARKWLLKSSPDFIGHFLEYIELLHSRWMSLEESLRSGRPAHPYTETFGETEWKTYTLGMMDLARLILPRVLPRLDVPAGASALLDACGSHGLYTIELLKRQPGLTAVIADLPQVTAITRGIVAAHGFSDRCSLLSCDVTQSGFGSERYDLVLAFNIIHGFTPATNRSFLSSLQTSLKRGGSIAILDQLIEEGRPGVGGLLPLMVGINLINETGGRSYSYRDVRSWLESAGFTGVRQSRVGLPGVHLVQARKR